MSDLITKLLQGKTVEWKTLGEVCEFKNGFAFKSNLFKESGLPIIRITNIDGLNVNLNDIKYFNPVDYSENIKCYEIIKGNILIAMSGATTGKIGFYNQKSVAYLNQRVGKFLPKTKVLNNRYLYHYLLLNVKTIYMIAGGGAQANLSSNNLMGKLQIPIPPLSVQAEIVRILDSFTALTAELAAELSMRKKQYNYYRDTLLTFKDGQAEWKTLGEVGEFIRGNGLQKKDFTETGFPAIHYGQIYTKYNLFANKTFTFISNNLAKKLRIADKNDLLIATTSENDDDVLKCVGWLGEKAAISGDMILFRHGLNVKYLAYYFQTQVFQSQKQQYISGTKVKRISKDNLKKFKIPIPPLAEQERIAAILDQFDTITNSITEGLPREIALRQQQYEYYREQLLNFPQP